MSAAAYHKWVCFACRCTAKRALLDVRSPHYRPVLCHRCSLPMLWIGTAFRPPRRDDDEAWQVAERLADTGFRFDSTRSRRRVPRTLAELDAWTAERAAPDAWHPEEQPTITTGPRTSKVRARGRTLRHGERVLVHIHNAWVEGRLKLLGDGGRALRTPVVVVDGAKIHSLGPRSRVRVLSRVS